MLQARGLFEDIVFAWINHRGQLPPALADFATQTMNMSLLTAVLARLGEQEGCGGPGQCTSCDVAATAAAAKQGDLEVRRARALALRSCANTRCTDLRGPSEAALRGRTCGGCHLVRYCSVECSRADWRGHRRACRLLQAQEQQQRAAAGQG